MRDLAKRESRCVVEGRNLRAGVVQWYDTALPTLWSGFNSRLPHTFQRFLSFFLKTVVIVKEVVYKGTDIRVWKDREEGIVCLYAPSTGRGFYFREAFPHYETGKIKNGELQKPQRLPWNDTHWIEDILEKRSGRLIQTYDALKNTHPEEIYRLEDGLRAFQAFSAAMRQITRSPTG